MLTAVNINNQSIKVVAAEQKKIVRWETVALSPGLIKDGQILQPEAIAKILDELFANVKLPRDKVLVSVTGMSFIYRILTLPKLKSADLPEAIIRATQKEINVPVEDLYIDWQVVSEKSGRLEIFVLGAARAMVDSLVNTFKLANVRLSALDLNSLALARLVNQPGALIADFGRDWFDIVIVAGGLPVTLHSVSPKGGFREFEDTLGQMDEEIRRTVDFFNLTHKDNFIPPAEAVVLSGIRKNNGVERALVEKYFPLVSPSPDGRLVYPEGFIPDEYAVLLGLILKPQTAIGFKKAGQAVYQDINLNLLSGRSRIQRKSLSVKQLMVPVSIVLAVIILVPLFLMHNSGLAENRSLQTQLEQVNRELKVRRLALVQSDISETQIAKYLSDSKSIQDQRNLLSGQGDLAVQVDSILKGLSANLRYTGIVSTATQIVLDGLADSRVDVLNYTSYLESQNLFPEVRIAAIEDVAAAGEGGTIISGQVSFTIILERQVNE